MIDYKHLESLPPVEIDNTIFVHDVVYFFGDIRLREELYHIFLNYGWEAANHQPYKHRKALRINVITKEIWHCALDKTDIELRFRRNIEDHWQYLCRLAVSLSPDLKTTMSNKEDTIDVTTTEARYYSQNADLLKAVFGELRRQGFKYINNTLAYDTHWGIYLNPKNRSIDWAGSRKGLSFEFSNVKHVDLEPYVSALLTSFEPKIKHPEVELYDGNGYYPVEFLDSGSGIQVGCSVIGWEDIKTIYNHVKELRSQS